MLQGTLDVFSLDEVLGLLSGAKKSGVLNVTGDRGVGSVSISDGLLVDGSVSANVDAVALSDIVFELLRFEEGSFSFDGDTVVEGEPNELETVLIEAHSRLEEWRGIEAVVPSLDHNVSLADTLPTADVSIDEFEWAAIVAIGEGTTVGTVADRLGLGEFDGSKRMMGLVDRSLVSITEGITALPSPSATVAAPDLSTPVETPAFDTSSFGGSSFDASHVEIDASEPVSFDLASEPVVDEAPLADEAPAFSDEVPVLAELDDEIPPMPVAPVVADVDAEIPPMPEPPSHFGDEASLAGEFAAPIDAESVDALPAPDNEASAAFGGLDPIGSVDMFEPPQRTDVSPDTVAAQDEMPQPPPPAPGSEIPSFAPPAFDPDDFPVNNESDNPFDAGDSAPAVSAFGDPGFGDAPFAAAETADPAPVDPSADVPADEADSHDGKGGSLLMRYLKSNG